MYCAGCTRDAAIIVNGFPVCFDCVDLASEADETPILTDLPESYETLNAKEN
jgi:hypothetical protein